MAGQELHFYETASGDWFYLIEDRHAPDAWDWMEFATAHGPFPTYEAAAEHEYRSDSDTSGATVVSYAPGSIPKTALDMITERRAALSKAS